MGDTYFIYARKSTDEADRQIRSIDDQLSELREFAKRNGYLVKDELTESRTARVPGRPVFNELLQRISRGEANGILAWHPDRLSRNSVDGGQLIWLIDQQSSLKNLKFPTFWFEPTPQGKLMLSIAFGMSKYTVDKLSEDVKRGLWGKVRSGLWPQRAPVGYVNRPDTGIIAIDPKRAPLVRTAFEMYATGEFGLTDTQDRINDLGLTTVAGKPLSRSQYHRMFSNPLYCGLLRYKGETFEGKHEPVIPISLFNAVQSMIARKGKPRPSLKPYLYRGMLRCAECGKTLTTQTHKGHNYLCCSKHRNPCAQPYVREELVSNHLRLALRAMSMPAPVCDRLLVQLQDMKTLQYDETEAQRKSLNDRLTALDEQSDALLSLYLSKGISIAEYHVKKHELFKDRMLLKEHLTEFEQRPTSSLEPAATFISSLRMAADLADNGTDPEICDFMKTTRSNLKIRNKCLTLAPHGPWITVIFQGDPGRGPWASRAELVVGDGRAVPLPYWCAERDGVRTNELLGEIIAFFKDNPAWQ